MHKKSLHYASTPALNISNGGNTRLSQIPERYRFPGNLNFPPKNHQLLTGSTIYLHSSHSTHSTTSGSSVLSGGSDYANPENLGLQISGKDVRKAEWSLRGYKTRIFVCKCLANLYITGSKTGVDPSKTGSNPVWNLKFTGIPVLLLDLGTTRSRVKRQIQLLLLEKGTGFVLWKDVIDNLSKYQMSTDVLFHTLHLSTDHSVRIGLSFDSEPEARDFYNRLNLLTSDPKNISLSGPGLSHSSGHHHDPMQAAIMEEAKR